MSRVAELDHRIGRHEGKPNADCPICNPDVPLAASVAERPPSDPRWWDHSGGIAPAFPEWGAIWHKINAAENAAMAFIRLGNEPASGFWVPMTLPFAETLGENTFYPYEMVGPVQTEIGSGRWSSRSKAIQVTQTLPTEAALSSPLGEDLPRMAMEQNRAKLIVEMERARLFPISEIMVERGEDPGTFLTKITSACWCVPLPPE